MKCDYCNRRLDNGGKHKVREGASYVCYALEAVAWGSVEPEVLQAEWDAKSPLEQELTKAVDNMLRRAARG